MYRVKYLLAFVLFGLSLSGWGASLTAKVKLTLVDPSQIKPESPLSFEPRLDEIPFSQNEVHCSVDPQTGTSTGDLCQSAERSPASVNVSGVRGLAISVQAYSSSQVNGFRFVPRLSIADHNLVMTENVQALQLGGDLFWMPSMTLGGNLNLAYELEIVYP